MRKKKGSWLILGALLLVCSTMQDIRIVSSTSTATIFFEPLISSALIGETFNVDIAITDVANLYGWNILIHFDSAILNATSLIRGPFLETGGSTNWQLCEIFYPGEPYGVINNTAGYVIVGDTLVPPLPGTGVSGHGTLVSITFFVKAEGATSLSFDEDPTLTCLTTVKNHVKVSMPHETIDGFFNNFSPSTPPDTNASRAHIRDVAVTYVTAHLHAVPQGDPIYLNVTVKNQGSETATFDVTVSARRMCSDVVIHVGTQTVYDLPPETSEILNFVWNTTNAPFGSYNIISEAIFPEDDYPENNLFKIVIGGIYVPLEKPRTNVLSYLFKTIPTILVLVVLAMTGYGFIRILGSERLEWPMHLLGRGT